MSSSDKHWAQSYINDPLTAPDPSDETGPGSSFLQRDPETPSTTSAKPVTPPSSSEPRRLSKTNPYRNYASPKQTTTSAASELKPSQVYPSPPPSASPRHSPRNSAGHREEFMSHTGRPRRSSSLKERFPGDPSVNPLDQLSREKAVADRARHATKKHAIKPDTIDSLDSAGLGQYHHEGPYDATLFARNNSWKSSPVAAVAETNQEALKATPHDKVVDSIRGHRPLDGVAAYPPGTTDRNGQTYTYQEGDNMMIEENAGGGPYKRWAGVQYHPDDIKGKGEPSYSIEKALKEHSLNEKPGYKDEEGLEMTINRSRAGSNAYRKEFLGAENDENAPLGRSGSLSNRLKKRIGSLKKKVKDEE